MSAQVQPIVIAAGGTGGHIYPALAVVQELSKRNTPVIWIGTREGLEARIVQDAGIDIRWINVAGWRGKGMLGFVTGPVRLVGALLQSIKILNSVRAGAVLGMGGFVSGPVGLAALIIRKPLVLHEQNAIAGMTNRYLSRFAKRVFAAMPSAFSASSKVTVCGNPVRSDIESVYKDKKQLSVETEQENTQEVLHILVVGGSRGAHALNTIVPEASSLLPNKKAIFRHQTGQTDEQMVDNAYRVFTENGGKAHVNAYIENMADAYAWADIVICRAGAMTVSELSAAAKPSILVPYPYAVDDHQTLNARYLSEVGAALLIPQAELNAKSLSSAIINLIDNRTELNNMSVAAYKQYKPNAAAIVAEALVEATR